MKRFLAAALLAGAAFACGAQGLARDPTGLWYDPAESGWGLSLAQQNDTTFAVLFVYDPAHRPTWYFASAVRFEPPIGFEGATFGGDLYRANGPWFGGPFDPAQLAIVRVGHLDLRQVNIGGYGLEVDYSVDGVSVSKIARPQTWGSNLGLIGASSATPDTGTYAGGAIVTSKSPDTCPAGTFASDHPFPFEFTVRSGPEPDHVFISWGKTIDTGCRLDGRYSQQGQLGAISGDFSCGEMGFTPPASDLQIQITEIAATPDGFSAGFTLQTQGCTYGGNIGGVRVAD